MEQRVNDERTAVRPQIEGWRELRQRDPRVSRSAAHVLFGSGMVGLGVIGQAFVGAGTSLTFLGAVGGLAVAVLIVVGIVFGALYHAKTDKEPSDSAPQPRDE